MNAPLAALLCLTILLSPNRGGADDPPAVEEEDAISPDRPGIADGSGVVGRGRFQIETGLQMEWRESDAQRERAFFFPTLARVGIGDRLEARVEGNTYTRVRVTEAGTEVGLSDGFAPLSLGLKARFQEAQGSRRPSLGAILRVFPPSGSSDFHTSHVTGDLRLAADWDFAPRFSLNPNLGVAVVEDESGERFSALLAALTLSFAPKNNVGFFADVALQSPEQRDGETVLIFDAGATLVLGKDVQLDVSIGAGAAGSTPPHPFLAAGVSRRF